MMKNTPNCSRYVGSIHMITLKRASHAITNAERMCEKTENMQIEALLLPNEMAR